MEPVPLPVAAESARSFRRVHSRRGSVLPFSDVEGASVSPFVFDDRRRSRDLVAVGLGSVGEPPFNRRPRRPKEFTVAVLFQRFFTFPVAVGREHTGYVQIAPELEVMAAREIADLGRCFVKLVQKLIDGVGGERHSHDADEHDVGGLWGGVNVNVVYGSKTRELRSHAARRC